MSSGCVLPSSICVSSSKIASEYVWAELFWQYASELAYYGISRFNHLLIRPSRFVNSTDLIRLQPWLNSIWPPSSEVIIQCKWDFSVLAWNGHSWDDLTQGDMTGRNGLEAKWPANTKCMDEDMHDEEWYEGSNFNHRWNRFTYTLASILIPRKANLPT